MISANAQKVSVWLVGFGANVLSGIARFVIDSLITFVVVFFLFRDGAQWAYRAGTLLPLSREQVARLYRNISDTIIANVYGILTVGVAQGVLVGVALRIIGMQSALLFGLATGFASIIPVVGSALVWAPVTIYLLATGSIGKGLFFLIYCVVIVSSVDNIFRPWVVGGRVELHPLVLLFFILAWKRSASWDCFSAGGGVSPGGSLRNSARGDERGKLCPPRVVREAQAAFEEAWL